MMAWLMASFHYLALALGVMAIYSRIRALEELKTPMHIFPQIRKVLFYDTLWGVAVILWIGSGLVRTFGSTEKSSDFYVHNPFFHIKMFFFILILILEIKPLMTMIKWRTAVKKEQHVNITADQLKTLVRICKAQLHTIFLLIFIASAMARYVSFN